jgi:CYTH domain-containing protein
MVDSDTGRCVRKLTKKFESDSPYYRTLNRVLLSESEYRLFDQLDGDRLKKTRHYQHHRGRVFSVDVFEGELTGLVLCETEATKLADLMAAKFPD